MKKDRSPAGAAAEHATPPEDAAPHPTGPAEPTPAPARTRRTSTSRTSRARKAAVPEPADAPKAPAGAPAITLPSAEQAPEQAPEQAAPVPLIETLIAGAEPAPEAAAAPEVQSAEAKPRRPARTRAPRKPRTAPPPAEDVAAAPPRTPSAVEAVAPVVPPVEAPVEAAETAAAAPHGPTIEAEAPVQERAAPARTRSSRRRGGRRTAEAPEAPPAPPARVPEPEVPVPAPLIAVEAAPEPPVAPPAIAAPSGRRRPTRRRVEEAEDLSRSGARLVTRRSQVELHINGTPFAPVFFFGNMQGEKERRRVISEVQRAARAGVHLHSTLIELPCPLPADDSAYEAVDEHVQTILEADPTGWVMPRIVFEPAPGWKQQYPDEVERYADGKPGDPSIASERFWQEAERSLLAVIEHIQRTTYGERVIGFHLEHGEWFHPKDTGYDRSFANREAFRAWLREKYHHSESALRAAWFDGQVQFYTADIPPLPPSPQPDRMFFDPRKERKWIDFMEFTSESTADRLITLSRVVKQATGNRALVSVCYGYVLEFAHTYSGHLALARLLSSPAVDIIAGPPSYRDRLPGEAGSYPSPVDSMALHGKLWLSEDDTKTYLAPAGDPLDDYNPRVDSRPATEQVQMRAMGRALAHQTGVAWMDLWGEGWLDAPDIWDRIGGFVSRYTDFIRQRKPPSPEVVVLISERSLLHVQRGEAFLRKLLHSQHEMIQRSGASVAFVLQSDVTARSFPTDAKLYLFLAPYRVPAEQRAAIKEKLHAGGKTLVWMYAPGACTERGRPDETAHDVVGISLRPQPWGSEIGSRIVESRHPMTDQLQNRVVGTRERLTPSYFVDDDGPNLTVVGEYVQTGLPSIAVREFGDWRSVYCGEPLLTPDLLRGLYRLAGVHAYCVGAEDFVLAGDGWLTLHTVRDGHRAVLLPRPSALYDVNELRLVGDALREYRTFLRGRCTRTFLWGDLEELYKLGLPGVERTRGRRRRAEGPAEGPQAVVESAPAPPEAAETAAGGEALPVAEAFAQPEEQAAEAAQTEEAPQGEGAQEHKRRRRRRGGRGRGGRGRGRSGEQSTGAPPPSE